MTAIRSFGEQADNYFVRPTNGMPTSVVEHPAAWRGEDLAADPSRWLVSLTDEQIADISAAADALITEGVSQRHVTAGHVQLPSLDFELPVWQSTLRDGLGVVCLRGLPVRAWGAEKSAMAFWALGHRIGTPGPQNPAGDLLGHVTDDGQSGSAPLVRLYRTADEIAFHCDGADVVGLCCLRTARSGGQSRIASSVTVYNELVSEHPELAAELFEVFDVDRRDEQAAGAAPTFRLPPCSWDGSTLRTFWHSDYMRSAERHDSVEISDLRRQAINQYDTIANRDGVHLDMWLEEGDIQLVSNHLVVHARTRYEDHVESDERRHLLRLWLSLD